MQKDAKKLKVLSIIWPILSTIIIFLGAALIYLYANGYRFNFINQELRRTGVITIESEPFLADMYVGEKKVGKTPKSSSLEIGTYNISIKKDGYVTWNKDLTVVEGKITPVFPFLLFSDIKAGNISNINQIYVKSWESLDHNSYLLLTQNSKTKIYTLWGYRMNTSILDFSTNPVSIMTSDSSDFTILLSPDGQRAILTMKGTKIYTSYVIDTNKSNTLSEVNKLNIINPDKYIITWAKDNKKLIIENSTKISSYNIEKGISIDVLTKVKGTSYAWTTDKEGFFYLVQPIVETGLDNVYIYKVSQFTINGTVTSKDLIEKIYLLKSDEYIKQYRVSNTLTSEFTNSPECTQTGGQITQIDVNQSARGIYIKTTLASYWYFADIKKYQMISSYPSDLVEYSPDTDKLIFKTDKNFGIFTIEKEKEDHTTEIGSKEIKNITDITKVSTIKWISDSLHIYYMENTDIYFTDINGENKTKLVQRDNILGYTIVNSRNTLKLITKEDTGISITEYRIH